MRISQRDLQYIKDQHAAGASTVQVAYDLRLSPVEVAIIAMRIKAFELEGPMELMSSNASRGSIEYRLKRVDEARDVELRQEWKEDLEYERDVLAGRVSPAR